VGFWPQVTIMVTGELADCQLVVILKADRTEYTTTFCAVDGRGLCGRV